MTYALALVVVAYVAIGFSWASYIMGLEEGNGTSARPDLKTRWFDLVAVVVLWPVLLAAGVIADILGGS